MPQDLRGENESNPPQEHKMAKPVPKIKQKSAPPPQSQNQSYQRYPPRRSSRISPVTILLSIIVIILLIVTIMSVASLSSEIAEINDELDDTESEQDDLSDELEATKSELNKISNELNDTIDDYDELKDDYDDLEDDYDELKDDYDNLATQTQKNELPHASFIPETIKPYQTETIRFDGGGSNDVDGEIIEYKWDFGNGDYASGYMVDYSFEELGTYTVTLTVTDNNSTKNSTSEEITVENAIVITISEASQYGSDPEDYKITLTLKNNGEKTANTVEAYWSLQTIDEALYTPDYVNWEDYVIGGGVEDFDLIFYDVTGIPNKLIYNDPPYHQEV
ncbi:MAG: PKD domain-containing protein, partial [Thermoplasmata archaeon]|nr:PKD domain-containing protein [Thermoplasmata archaeon]